MNIIDRMKISRKPNSIDEMPYHKITEEVVEYAIQHGYTINPDSIGKFIVFKPYMAKFGDTEEVLNYEIEQARNEQKLSALFLHCKENCNRFAEIVSNDDELIRIMIEGNYFHMMGENNIIKLVKEKPQLLDEIVKRYSDAEELFTDYIASLKDPQEILTVEESKRYEDAIIRTADPRKILQLLNAYPEEIKNERLKAYETKIAQTIESNIPQFLGYFNDFEKLFGEQLYLVNPNLKKETMNYLKKNNVMYSPKLPKFVQEDTEYGLQCILNDPQMMQNFPNACLKENINRYESEISQRIVKDKICFENIPYGLTVNGNMQSEMIFWTIVRQTPELIDRDVVVQTSIRDKIKDMEGENAIEFLRSIDYPFDSAHAIQNVAVLIECLKNDYMTYSNTRHEFTQEEYHKIYEAMKDRLTVEQIEHNSFLLENPYFLKELIRQGIEIDVTQVLKTQCYEDMYLDLKAESIKHDVYIPKPPKFSDVIQFEGNSVFVEADDLESIRKGLEYIKQNDIKQDLTIILRQGELDEFLISDNIEFFQELMKNNTNLNFKYNNGQQIFNLEKVLQDEETMQQIVTDIKDKNLSPLEQAVAVYDISKTFKPYKYEGKEDGTAASRSFFEYMNNNYMVCAGYADLIVNLGHRLNAQYAEISLGTIRKADNRLEGHGRNYINIVDPKYGIDGFYALEPTWEQSGRTMPTRFEEMKSTYKRFLMTTDEGRQDDENEISLNENVHSGYDVWLTYDNPEQLKDYLKDSLNQRHMMGVLKNLAPDLYKQVALRDLTDIRTCSYLINEFKQKVNNPVPKEKILDAIIEVKKKIYVNLSEQDFEDMKMGYSITDPFAIYDEGSSVQKSLYGKEYEDYLLRRYNDIKDQTMTEAGKNNSCMIVPMVVDNFLKMHIEDEKAFAKENPWGFSLAYDIQDDEYIQNVLANQEKIQNLGFEVSYTKETNSLNVAFPVIEEKDRETLTIEQIVNRTIELKHKFYETLERQKNDNEEQSR